MNLNEAIKHCKEVAKQQEVKANELYKAKDFEESRDCIWCSKEHEQLAEWLKELKKFREQQPYEKFESTKDHIYKLADDYKCWDNRLTEDEAVELCHILEQQPEDAISMMDLLNNLHKHFSKGFETDEWWNSTHVLQAVKDCRPELFDLNYVPPVQPKKTECEDAISREDAIKQVLSFYTNCERLKMFQHTANEVKQTVGDILSDLPPVQPKPKTGQWIPVSERLPKPRIDVWCNSDMGQMVGYYEEHVKTWYGRDYLELMVTAWMPLPKPYKAESEE